MRVLPGEPQHQLAERALERRPPRFPMCVRPAARNELAVPAQQRVRFDREARPNRSRHRATERRQRRPISTRQPWPASMPPQHRQLMTQKQDLNLLRATSPRQQPHQREQIPRDQIHERPEQATPPSTDGKSPEPNQSRRTESRGRVCEPYALLARGVPRLVDEDPRRKHSRNAHGDVDEEDPAPADVLGEQAAEERADRERERRDPRPDPDRRSALPRREGRGDDRERRRVHQRRADPPRGARGNQGRRVASEAAPERRGSEDDQAGNEDPPTPEQVGELAAAEQQDTEGERVRIEDPLQLGRAHAEVLLDRRQRHGHNRVVQHDHEQADRDCNQRPPFAIVGGEDSSSHPDELRGNRTRSSSIRRSRLTRPPKRSRS